MRNNFLNIIIIFLFLSSCSGFKMRSDRSDEFLIEKKNPLVMPPDIDNLPEPKESTIAADENNEFQNILKDNEIDNNNASTDNSSLTNSIIKKIE